MGKDSRKMLSWKGEYSRSRVSFTFMDDLYTSDSYSVKLWSRLTEHLISKNKSYITMD